MPDGLSVTAPVLSTLGLVFDVDSWGRQRHQLEKCKKELVDKEKERWRR